MPQAYHVGMTRNAESTGEWYVQDLLWHWPNIKPTKQGIKTVRFPMLSQCTCAYIRCIIQKTSTYYVGLSWHTHIWCPGSGSPLFHPTFFLLHSTGAFLPAGINAIPYNTVEYTSDTHVRYSEAVSRVRRGGGYTDTTHVNVTPPIMCSRED